MQKKLASMMGLAAVASLALAACGSGDSGSSSSAAPESPENGDKAALNIGVMAGWDEGVAVSNLWKQILDQKGYDVEQLRKRGRKPLGDGPARVAPVRLDDNLLNALDERAERDHTTRSELIRAALRS